MPISKIDPVQFIPGAWASKDTPENLYQLSVQTAKVAIELQKQIDALKLEVKALQEGKAEKFFATAQLEQEFHHAVMGSIEALHQLAVSVDDEVQEMKKQKDVTVTVIDSQSTPVVQSATGGETAMPYEYKPIPEWTEIPAIANDPMFAQAMDRAEEIKQIIEDLETELSDIKEIMIEPALLGAQVKGRVRYKTLAVGMVHREGSKRIDKKKLVVALEKRGYELDVVEESTVTGQASEYLWLGKVKEKGGSDEGAGEGG